MEHKIEVVIDLNDHLSAYRGRDPETGEVHEEPQTLESIIIERAAQLVAERAVSSRSDSTYSSVTKRADDLLTAAVARKVDAALDAELSTLRAKTDQWGTAVEAPKTLTERIEEAVHKALTAPVHDPSKSRGSFSSGGETKPLISWSIDAHVAKGLDAKVAEAVAAEQARIVEAVSENAAGIMSKALGKAIGR